MVSPSLAPNDNHSGEFFVYLHTRNDDGAPFYVGKGTGKRHLTSHGRNSLWSRVASKHGFTPHILQDRLTEDAAFALERELVREFRDRGAFLANLTDGGEGPAGRTFSPETREKMRQAKLGRKLAPEHAAKIGAAHRGRRRSPETIAKLTGAKRSHETRALISKAKTGLKMHPNAKAALAKAKAEYVCSAAHRAKLSEKLSGTSNPHHDATVHQFVHAEHGVRSCTQCELRLAFGLPHSNLSRVVSGQRNAVHGWRLVVEKVQ